MSNPKPCTDKRCLNGWFRWHGSDYPCGACESYSRFYKKLQEDKTERRSEAYAFLF